jgi:hypothetical protein
MDKPLLSRRTWQLLVLTWGILTLGLLGQAVRNGRYVPVPGRPHAILDTRSGELHFVRVADSVLDEARAAEEK